MSTNFYDWIKKAYVGCAADQKAIHSKLRTQNYSDDNVTDSTWQILCNLHYVAQRDQTFPTSGGEDDYRQYFVKAFTDPDLASQHRVVQQDKSLIETAYNLLYRRFLKERSMDAKQLQKHLPSRNTPSEMNDARQIWTWICIGMMLFGFLVNGFEGLGAMIGVFGTMLLVVWCGGSRGNTRDVDIPGGRPDDMYNGGD